MNNILGVHYLFDFYDCDINELTSVSKIKSIMVKILFMF